MLYLNGYNLFKNVSVSNTLATKSAENIMFSRVSDYTRHNPAYRLAHTYLT